MVRGLSMRWREQRQMVEEKVRASTTWQKIAALGMVLAVFGLAAGAYIMCKTKKLTAKTISVKATAVDDDDLIQPTFLASLKNWVKQRIYRKKGSNLETCDLVLSDETPKDHEEVSAEQLTEVAKIREFHGSYTPDRDSKKDRKQRKRFHLQDLSMKVDIDLPAIWCAVFNSGASKENPLVGNKHFECAIDGEKITKMWVEEEEDLIIVTDSFTTSYPKPESIAIKTFHSQETEDLSLKIRRNMVTIGRLVNGVVTEIGVATFMRGTIAIMPYHFLVYIRSFDPKTQITLRAFGQSEPQIIALEDVLAGRRVGDRKDLWMFDAKLSSSKRDLTKSLIDQRDLDKLAKVRVRLVTRESGKTPDYNTVVFKEGQGKYVDEVRETPQFTLVNGEKAPSENFLSCIETNIPTTSGQCGGLLLVDNNFIRGKICGSLSLGDATHSSDYSPLYKEEVMEALNTFKPFHGYVAMGEPETVTVTEVELPIDGNFAVEGTAPPVYHPPKTTLEKTEIFDKVYPNDMLPSVLRRTMDKETDIAFKGLRKNATPRKPLDKELLAECAADVERILFTSGSSFEDSPRRVLTFEEAVKGIEGEEFIKPINRTSSAGYPWCKNMARGVAGKRTWFGADEDYKLDSPPALQVKEHLERMVDRAREGIRSEAIFIDTAKDELRPYEIVDGEIVIKKTRMFAAGPMHLILLARQYYLSFFDFIQKNRIENGIAVGVNPCSNEWTKLAHRMLKYECVVAGDFGDYDGNIHLELMQAAFDIADHWYNDGPENSQIRRTICAMIAQSQHLLDGIVYDWDHSQPSGQPFTAPLNSIINLIVMRMAWRIATGRSLVEYNREVVDMAYGDDNMLSMSKETHSYFNQQMMTDALATIGMVYTDEAKTGDLSRVRTLTDVEFLKRKFVWREDLQMWTAPLNMRSIGRTLNWRQAGPDPEGVLASNIGAVLRELSLHPKEVYDDYYKRIMLHTPREVMARVETEPTYEAWGRFWRSGKTYDNKWFMMESEETATPAMGGATETAAEASRLNDTKRDFPQTGPTLAEGGAQGGEKSVLSSQETTTFHHERKPAEYQYISKIEYERKFSDMLSACVRDYTNVEITNFLRTPVKIGQVTWTAASDTLSNHQQPTFSQSLNAPLFTFNHPEGLIPYNMINLKLQQMTYLRADMVIRTVLNAQPFQCGSLRATGTLPISGRTQAFNGSCMTTYTSQPGYTHNITSGDQQFDYRLKPIGPRLYYSLTETDLDAVGTWMDFNLHALTPLRDPQGTGKVEITFFAWYENVDIRFRSGAPLAIAPSLMDITPTTNPEHRNMRYKQFHMEAEQQAKGGSVSGVCNSLAGAANLFSMVPGVGQFASAASSTLSAVGGIAAALGHSKPSSQATITKAQLFQANDSLSMDGEFLGHQLGGVQQNAIETGATAGSGHDEMALAYIMKQPAILEVFTLDDSQTPGTQIYSIRVNPQQYWYEGDRPGNYVFAGPPLTMALLPFQYWAGSLVFEFEMMKTQYHSGSLEIIYIPRYYANSIAATIDPNTCFREIWDFSKSRTFKFVCPFVNAKQWLRCLSLGEEAYSVQPTLSEYTAGMLYIRVLNTMTLSQVVSPKVDILVQILPGEDFRYGGITSCQSMPWDGFTTTFQKEFHMEEGSGRAPRMTRSDKLVEKVSHQKIDGLGNGVERTFQPHTDTAPKTAMPLATTIGEGIFSARQIIKRFCPVQVIGLNPTDNNVALIQPNTFVQTCAQVLFNTDSRRPDWINHFQSMFAVRSGGMRVIASITEWNTDTKVVYPCVDTIRVLPQNNLWNDQSAQYEGFAAAFKEGYNKGEWHGQTAGEQLIPLQQEGVINLDVPMYSDAHVLWNEYAPAYKGEVTPGTPNNGDYIQAYNNNTIPANQIVLARHDIGDYTQQNWQISVMRAARDDYGLFIFAGCPMVHFYPSRVYTTNLPQKGMNIVTSITRTPLLPTVKLNREEQILERAPRARANRVSKALTRCFTDAPDNVECDDDSYYEVSNRPLEYLSTSRCSTDI